MFLSPQFFHSLNRREVKIFLFYFFTFSRCNKHFSLSLFFFFLVIIQKRKLFWWLSFKAHLSTHTFLPPGAYCFQCLCFSFFKIISLHREKHVSLYSFPAQISLLMAYPHEHTYTHNIRCFFLPSLLVYCHWCTLTLKLEKNTKK
jgi:hypothetical protein